jgi:hypothetical protein
VLNLHAGPSYGIGVLPADAAHEARERDYFFAIAFAMWAAWAAMGGTMLGAWIAARIKKERAVAIVALAIAAIPIAFNWRVSNRAGDGPPTLAQRFATALLDSVSPNAVLFVAGDNDTYPLWFEQIVEQKRPDVTIVTIPLLPADWYRWELARRQELVPPAATDSWRGLDATIQAIATRAVEHGRQVAVAASVPARQREALGAAWSLRGVVYERDSSLDGAAGVPVRAFADSLAVTQATSARVFVDTAMAARFVAASALRHVIDPAEGYVSSLLNCPAAVLAAVRAGRGSVDPRCNLR